MNKDESPEGCHYHTSLLSTTHCSGERLPWEVSTEWKHSTGNIKSGFSSFVHVHDRRHTTSQETRRPDLRASGAKKITEESSETAARRSQRPFTTQKRPLQTGTFRLMERILFLKGGKLKEQRHKVTNSEGIQSHPSICLLIGQREARGRRDRRQRRMTSNNVHNGTGTQDTSGKWHGL